MNRQRFIGLALGLYLLFMISLIPARTIQLFLPDTIQLSQLQGSLWSGHAQRVTINQQSLEDVSWSFAWWSLLSSCIGINIEQQQANNFIDARVGISWSGKSCISSLDGEYAAKVVGPWINPSLPQLGGVLEFNDVGIWLVNGMPVDAEGVILWRNASINTGSVLSLGEYQLLLQEAEAEEGITITLRENKKRFEGKLLLTVTTDRRLEAKGKLRPRNANDPLKPFMGLLGPVDDDGSYVVDRKLVLPR